MPFTSIFAHAILLLRWTKNGGLSWYESATLPPEKDKIIGFLLYSLIYDRIEIEQFEVITKERGKGIGDKLLKYLIEKYQDTDIKNITLEVKEDNIVAINLYEKYGFKKVSTREKYYDGINGLLMEKTL